MVKNLKKGNIIKLVGLKSSYEVIRINKKTGFGKAKSSRSETDLIFNKPFNSWRAITGKGMSGGVSRQIKIIK